MKQVILICITISALFSCAPKLSADHNWGNKKWVLTELNGVPVQLSGTDKDAHLVFNTSEKAFSGSGGCNRISGSYALNKKQLSFSKIISTKMACPNLEFEDKFLKLLEGECTFELTGNELLMKKGDQVIFKFK